MLIFFPLFILESSRLRVDAGLATIVNCRATASVANLMPAGEQVRYKLSGVIPRNDWREPLTQRPSSNGLTKNCAQQSMD